jgi:hypothetical protein
VVRYRIKMVNAKEGRRRAGGRLAGHSDSFRGSDGPACEILGTINDSVARLAK